MGSQWQKSEHCIFHEPRCVITSLIHCEVEHQDNVYKIENIHNQKPLVVQTSGDIIKILKPNLLGHRYIMN